MDLSKRLQKGIQGYYNSQLLTRRSEYDHGPDRPRHKHLQVHRGQPLRGVPAQPLLPPRGQRRFRLAQVLRLPGNLGPERFRTARAESSGLTANNNFPTLRREARRRHRRIPRVRPDLGAPAFARRQLRALHGRDEAAGLERFDADLRRERRPASLLQDHAALAHRGAPVRLPSGRQPSRRPLLRRNRHAPRRFRSTASTETRRPSSNARVPVSAHRFHRDADPRLPRHPGKGLRRRRRRGAQGPAFQFWSDYTLCGIRGVGVPGCNGSSGGLADYGFGLELNFLGLPLHFDFARQWNFKEDLPPGPVLRDRPTSTRQPAAISSWFSTSGRSF